MDKDILRRQVIEIRDQIQAEDRKRWSLEIEDKLWVSDYYKRASIVLSYASFRSEVSTDHINNHILEDGKRLYLPKTYHMEHRMRFFEVEDMANLACGYQHIREPMESSTPFEEDGIDGEYVLMLMPGVAYDSKGYRIGYGGGYYDRYLDLYGDQIHTTCMLAYQVQKTDNIEVSNFDIKPKHILTNND